MRDYEKLQRELHSSQSNHKLSLIIVSMRYSDTFQTTKPHIFTYKIKFDPGIYDEFIYNHWVDATAGGVLIP